MTISQWHVPVDDNKHYWYAIFTSFGAPVNKEEMRRQRRSSTNCPTTRRARTSTTITASIRTSRSTRPLRAWAPTSTCTTSGPASRWAKSRIAPGSTSASPTRRSTPTAVCCGRDRSRKERRDAADGARSEVGAEPHRTGRDRRHRPDRRLAGVLEKDRRREAPGRELGEWTVIAATSAVVAGRGNVENTILRHGIQPCVASSTRKFVQDFLLARRALEFSHSLNPKRTSDPIISLYQSAAARCLRRSGFRRAPIDRMQAGADRHDQQQSAHDR